MPPKLLPGVQILQGVLYIFFDRGVVSFIFTFDVGIVHQIIQVVFIGGKLPQQLALLQGLVGSMRCGSVGRLGCRIYIQKSFLWLWLKLLQILQFSLIHWIEFNHSVRI